MRLHEFETSSPSSLNFKHLSLNLCWAYPYPFKAPQNIPDDTRFRKTVTFISHFRVTFPRVTRPKVSTRDPAAVAGVRIQQLDHGKKAPTMYISATIREDETFLSFLPDRRYHCFVICTLPESNLPQFVPRQEDDHLLDICSFVATWLGTII